MGLRFDCAKRNILLGLIIQDLDLDLVTFFFNQHTIYTHYLFVGAILIII